MTRPGSALRVHGLSVRLGATTVLADVDVEVRRGEWLGLIGPNGAGKSTLLRTMAGLTASTTTTGTIALDDGRRPRPTDLALMPQAPTLPPGMSVVEYVLLGRTAHLGWLQRESRRDREVATRVLRRLDLAALAGRSMSSLSGGEAQRVAVARSLAQQSPLLLLDEPTSSLDVGHQVEVLDLVDELRRSDGLTVVAAMHDLGLAARYADRLLLLDRGRVVGCDEPARVLEPDLLSQVYGAPLQVHDLDGQLVVVPSPRVRSAW